MKKISLLFLTTFLLCLLGFSLAYAAKFQAAEELYLDTTIFDDTYVAGRNVTINNHIYGDLFVTGGDVKIYGDVDGDVLLLAGNAVIKGNVKGDLRAAGGQIWVQGKVGEDAIIGAGTIDIDKNVVIGKDLLAYGGMLTLNGNVNGNLQGGASKIYFGGKVKGNAGLRTEEPINFLPNALISGNLKFSAPVKSEISKNNVQGIISYEQSRSSQKNILPFTQDFLTRGYLTLKLLSFLSLLLLGFLLLHLVPHFSIGINDRISASFLRNFGIGLILAILALPVFFICLISLVGFPLGIIILSLFIAVHYLAKVYAAFFMGNLIFKKIKKPTSLKLTGILAVGLLVVQIFSLVPLIGWIFSAVLTLAAFGTIMLSAKDLVVFLQSKKML